MRRVLFIGTGVVGGFVAFGAYLFLAAIEVIDRTDPPLWPWSNSFADPPLSDAEWDAFALAVGINEAD